MLRPSGADCPALPDMLTRLTTSLAAAGIVGLPKTLLADAGYFSAENVTAVTEAGSIRCSRPAGSSTVRNHHPRHGVGSRTT